MDLIGTWPATRIIQCLPERQAGPPDFPPECYANKITGPRL
jgi:hypothetical protein